MTIQTQQKSNRQIPLPIILIINILLTALVIGGGSVFLYNKLNSAQVTNTKNINVLQSFSDNIKALVDTNIPVLGQLADLQLIAKSINHEVLRFVLQEEETPELLKLEMKNFTEAYDKVSGMWPPGLQKNTIDQLSANIAILYDIADELYETESPQQLGELSEDSLSSVQYVIDSLLDIRNSINQINHQKITVVQTGNAAVLTNSRNFTTDLATINYSFILIGGVIMLLIICSQIWVALVIKQRLRIVRKTINDITATNDYSKRITGINSNDDIYQLVLAFNALLQANETATRNERERTLELTQKTLDMNAMLDNMKLGVFTVIKDNKIHPEYSNYLEVILDKQELYKFNIGDCLLNQCDLGVDAKDRIIKALQSIINEDELNYDFNAHLLIDDVQFRGTDGIIKILQLGWSPIVSENGMVEKVLVIAQDVTTMKQLELQAAEQRKELDIISQILKISIGKFDSFISSSMQFIDDNKALIERTTVRETDVIAALFRNMHTLKGNARTYELTFLTDIIHEVEQTYDKLRSDESMPWDASLLLDELELACEGLNMYVRINEDKLGRKGRASDLLTSRGSFISNEQIDKFKGLAADISQTYAHNTTIKRLENQLQKIGQIDLTRLASGAIDSVVSLAKELNKPTPEVSIVDLGISFNNAIAEPLKSSFMHIVRNSMDHGIESAEERTSANKNAVGKIEFEVIDKKDHVELRIRDDGRGLALHKLYQKALDNNILRDSDNPTPQAVANLLFNSGLSTSERVNKISGRGVGMDAVRTFLASQEASIHIELRQAANTEQQTGQLSFTPFDFIIMIPEESYLLSMPELT
jgi:hypothetical protein